MRISLRSLGLIGLLGGVGGAINAWLCYAKLPLPVGPEATFHWHLIPAGAGHGALLALIPVSVAGLVQGKRLLIRLIGLPVAGWLSGCLSWMCLDASLHFGGWKDFMHPDIELLWRPFPYFGLVGFLLFFFLALCGAATRPLLSKHLAFGVVSGAAGSLWWWLAWKPWYFSLIHGTIWGALVGFGVWKAQQADWA